jgi:hypothetical protein
VADVEASSQSFPGHFTGSDGGRKPESHHANAFVDLNGDGNADLVVTFGDKNK